MAKASAGEPAATEDITNADVDSAVVRPTRSDPMRNGLASELVASVCMSVCVLASAAASPFVRDGEGWVASKFPTSVAHFLRDSPSAWRTFNAWTWAFTAPALALGRPKLLRLATRRGPHEAFDLPYAHADDDGGQGCALDVYYHAADRRSASSGSSNASGLRPVVVFVHGGAWSQGSRQLFALMGRRLRDQLGAVVVVPGYRTWPRGDVAAQARDVGAALRWVREHAETWGGDPRRVVLVGHSSGAHLCATHLLTRGSSGETTSGASRSSRSSSRSSRGDVCAGTVRAFVGLCGVYDVGAHYAHEQRRGVHEVSAMKAAAGGNAGASYTARGVDAPGASTAASAVSAAELAAELAAAFAAASPTALAAATAASGVAAAAASGRAAATRRQAVPLRPVPLFPRTYLYHAADDATVPVRSTIEFADALRAGWPQAAVELEVLGACLDARNLDAAMRPVARSSLDLQAAALGVPGPSGGHGGVLLDVLLGDHPAPALVATLRRALAEV